jgi:ABC-2 type transport system ATP-binding protein
MTAIEVHELRKSYDDVEAVSGVDITVVQGEVFCLLGPNGAGKTTTVEILEGFRVRSGGDVSVLGHDPQKGERGFRERLGIVLQESGVKPTLTVAELLDMYGSYYARRRGTDELLELVELEDKRNTYAGSLSGGQRRRLDLALALVGDPDLVFLDEPTTGFDPSARRRAWSTIKGLCELGKTVFLTTHFMDEAQELADRIAVMREGRVVAAGTPEELGGRDEGPGEVRFVLPHGVELPSMNGDRVEVDGDRVLIHAHDPLLVSHRITGWALERGLELRGFTVQRPTLEDVYLRLTAATAEEA